MSWQEHIDFDQCGPTSLPENDSNSRMMPGLDGNYDKELREKSSLRNAPIPPEYMGFEGEYDSYGLAKRVAKVLDSHTTLAHLESLMLIQQGNTMVLRGKVPDQASLDTLVNTVSKVDGTHAIDVTQVEIA